MDKQSLHSVVANGTHLDSSLAAAAPIEAAYSSELKRLSVFEAAGFHFRVWVDIRDSGPNFHS